MRLAAREIVSILSSFRFLDPDIVFELLISTTPLSISRTLLARDVAIDVIINLFLLHLFSSYSRIFLVRDTCTNTHAYTYTYIYSLITLSP